MSVLEMGGEDDIVSFISGVMETVDNTKWRPAYARAAIKPTNDVGAIHTFVDDLADYIAGQVGGCQFWYGYRWAGGGGGFSFGNNVAEFQNAAGTPIFQICQAGFAQQCGIRFYKAGAYQAVPGPSIIAQSSTPTEHCFKIDTIAGTIEWWIGGVLWYTLTIDGSALTQKVAKVNFGLSNANGTAFFSEIRATSFEDPCVGMNVATLPYTGAGAINQWAGAHTDVNEITENTGTLNTTPDPDKDAVFAIAAPPALTGSDVWRAVAIQHRIRTVVAGGVPQNIKGLLKIGANYYASPQHAVGTVLGHKVSLWQASPATTARFTTAEITTLQAGRRSAA